MPSFLPVWSDDAFYSNRIYLNQRQLAGLG
jgi:hypothetical protein